MSENKTQQNMSQQNQEYTSKYSNILKCKAKLKCVALQLPPVKYIWCIIHFHSTTAGTYCTKLTLNLDLGIIPKGIRQSCARIYKALFSRNVLLTHAGRQESVILPADENLTYVACPKSNRKPEGILKSSEGHQRNPKFSIIMHGHPFF